MSSILINPILECNRCHNTWWRRKKELPKYCPACNSPYWNRPYTRGKPKKKKEIKI